MTRSPPRLVIVDDHQMVLDGLRAMLASYQGSVQIVGEACEHQDAIALVADVEPDMVLLDVRLHGSSGLDLCSAILRRRPECKVVFLTVYDDEQYLYQALRAGAVGYLLKRVTGEELVKQLELVQAGETVVDSALAGRAAASAARLQSGEFWPGAHLGLSHRESEVLSLLVAGLSNRKLGVGDRAGAVAAALREGIFR